MRLSYVSSFSRPEHRRNAIDYAALAEAAGYEGVWVPEAFSSDAFTLLGLIAGHTRRLKLATGIVNVFSRTPALLAQSFATLDETSDGRAVIGLGTSGPIVIQDWHGLRFEKPLTRTRETVEILRLALSGARVDYDGAIFKLKGFKLAVRPVQARIPVYLATFKSNAVRQTGEIADGWLPTHVSVRHVTALRAGLIEGARAAGRDPDAIDMAALTLVACTHDGETARALCREHLAYYVGGMGTFYQELLHGYGYGALADRIKALWTAGDRAGAADAIPREVLDDLVVAGTRAECRAALDARRAAGFGHVVAFPPHGIDPDQLRETLKAVAPNG
jgi:F420-dependent oxidoreductase-like protein